MHPASAPNRLPAAEDPIVTLLSYPLHESGGIAAFVRSLLATLEGEHGARFPLVAPAVSLPCQSTRWGQMRFAATALRRLLRLRPRAIQNHQHLPLLCSALLCKLVYGGRVRVIHTVHVDPAGRKPWVQRAVIGCLHALCDQVVVVSEDTQRRLDDIALPLRRNVEVIYGAPPPAPIPPEEALAAFARQFGLGPGPVICQITRFYFPLKVKGAERLLAAFRRVRQEVPDAQFLLVGSGPLWDSFKAEHGLDGSKDGVTLTGFVDDPLVPMALADVYCHVSFQDALPIVVLEAMGFGKAVVASDVGGIPEVIEHGVSGVLVGDDPDDLPRSLIRLLRAPAERAALGREAARQISERLTWTRCAAQYAALYGIAPEAAARGLDADAAPCATPLSVLTGASGQGI